MNANPPSPQSLVVALDGACTLTREELGSKAWGINRIRLLRLPAPPAITITTLACREHETNGGVPESLWAQIVQHMQFVETGVGRRFGDAQRPLLVSVRSGAAHSMPGMMDTVLNLGINADVEASLAAQSGDARYAAETHERFVEQYRKVVLRDPLGAIPADPWAQLRAAVAAVFDSWHSQRARVYRRNRGLSDQGGTAVTIQAMVFGNLDTQSGTGVLFSRNPITGEPPPWGEWLARGQGEDVVSGRYTPEPLDALRQSMPAVHAELLRATAQLEADAGDLQDIEFTVESGRLWLLQSRVAKRSPQAALRTAVAFAEEGLISKEAALRRLTLDQVLQMPALRLAPKAAETLPLVQGQAACPGVASGVVVVDADEAEARARQGEAVILARPNTSPEDLHGIIAAHALMTEQGGATSHAAVLSRELGRPCVVGCGSNTVTALVGQSVTLDGASGRVWAGNLALGTSEESLDDDAHKLLQWGAPLIALQLLRPEQAPAGAIDLDAAGEDWRAALRPGATLRGRVLDTVQGIRAALTSGARAAVVRKRLPALVACLQTPVPGTETQAALASEAAAVTELALLRLIALKGRASEAILADALGIAEASALYAPLCDQHLCSKIDAGLRLTATGRERLARLLAEERARVDPAALLSAYEDFCTLNAEVKQIMTAWQMKNNAMVNDHTDAGYDQAVLKRLADVHQRATPLLNRLTKLAPRLGGYADRLARAAARVAAGELSYVAKIIADSYHTVWFELHEDLLALAGLSRATLAQAHATRAG